MEYPAIKTENLAKRYKDTVALKEVSIEVPPGEIFGLIGPDGAGKTSLFRILASLLLPDDGSAWLFGHDVVTDYRDIRRMIGYMAGRFSLYQDLTVEENLRFYATVFGTRVEENYDLVKDIYSHLEPFRRRRAGKLSGGMKQKLALSCALIHSPRILILDEPTTGVDAVSRKEFWEMLIRLKEKGISILVSTPYMDEALMCDRVALIQKGAILSVDTPRGIISGYSRVLYSVRSSDLYRLMQDLRSLEQTGSVYLFGQELHVTVNDREYGQDDIKAYLSSADHRGIEIKEILPGIEDCFMDLMEEHDE
jgi:ABC-2 type transport system ATP-binding protein